MARNKHSATPPPTMTWGKASPVIALAVVFDLVRIFFLGFVFFGPAMLAAACTYETTGAVSTLTVGLLGTKTAALGCTAGVTGGVVAANFFTAGGVTLALSYFGQVMGMSIAIMAWFTLAVIIILTNRRLIADNVKALLPTLIGFGITQIPFIDFLPAITGTTWRLYHVQITTERATLETWKKEQAAERARELQATLDYQARLAQADEAQALALAEAEEEIPDEWPEAA